MSEYNIILKDDRHGQMMSSVVSPNTVATVIITLMDLAQKFEKIYDYLNGDYNNDTDIYIMLADVEEILDSFDMSTIREVQRNLGMMITYSKNPRWINSAMDDAIGPMNKHSVYTKSVLDILRDVVDEGDVISGETVDFLTTSIYNFISAAYQEVFYSYDLEQFFEGMTDIEITRGFNEAAIKMKKKSEEIAKFLHDKMMVFIFVSNEVDRDPEVSKKIRSQIPVDLAEDFESIIEYITAEQVDNILNGKIRINTEISCRKFIDSIENESDGEE